MGGLAAAQKSVGYILMLLLLVDYIFAVLGVVMFAENDPANFGTVPIAMLTLFQVSAFTNWASIAYVSYHGCDNFAGNGYVFDDDGGVNDNNANDDLVVQPKQFQPTMTGRMPTWDCQNPKARPLSTVIFFIAFDEGIVGASASSSHPLEGFLNFISSNGCHKLD